MLYNDRAAFILQQLQLKSTVKVTEIAKSLNVSVDTVRRDLKALEEQGQLKCVHGGASLPDYMLAFSNFSGREIIHIEEKRRAALKAAFYGFNHSNQQCFGGHGADAEPVAAHDCAGR